MNVKLCLISSVQGHDESCIPENSDALEEDGTLDDGVNDRKFIVFKSQWMKLFHSCHT